MNLFLEEQYRAHYGKLIASLISYFGIQEMAIAEDLVQDTFTSAANSWQTRLPDDPEAWLFRVCKNKALNYLNRNRNRSKALSLYEQNLTLEDTVGQVFLPHEIRDSKLRLIFALCHPKLPERTQVILVLRTLAGFRIPEIARGLGLSESAVKKTLVRGKQKIKEEGISLKVPFIFRSKQRLAMVHKALYLIFNEGYNASNGPTPIKQDLCIEAYTLTRTLIEEGINDSISHALIALMLFNMARMPARLTDEGHLIDLERQDRSQWERSFISQGFRFLKQARSGNILSSYHLEAGIASIHCSAPSFEATDWCAILALYDQLHKVHPSPFVAFNRCIALSYCESPDSAFEELVQLGSHKVLNTYYLYHVTLGKLCLEMGLTQAAGEHLKQGLDLTKIDVEKAYIRKLIQAN